MEPILVNARGDACPIPVVKTIKALDGMSAPGTVEVHVDNEAAVQNVTRLATHRGYKVSSEKLEEKHFVIRMEVSTVAPAAPNEAEAIPSSPSTPPAWAAATTSWAQRS